MTLYYAGNAALSTTTALGAGTSYATGAKVALQLNIPANMAIDVVEFGWTQDTATATATLLELATTNTASTVSTTHTTTTIKPYLNQYANASRLTMGTGATGYGNGAITSNTTLRTLLKCYAPQQLVYQWALGNWPTVGAAATEEFLQVRVNTTATVNGYCWLIYDEQ